ncbi:MAG: DUF559 domain-containing protein [Actinomycetota bacterium]|nr:DUF559 domain-containing protein [Actinomycetota bacterium]
MRNDSKLIELITGNHMLATRSLVQQAGLSPHQWQRLLRDDVWLPLVPGHWRHAATPVTWEMRVHAGAGWLGKDAALYGATAARWWDLDDCHTESVDFLVPRARRHLPPWLNLHTTTEWSGDVLQHKGIRTCSATRAIIDIARTASAHELESIIDSAVRLRRTSVPTLTSRMAQLSGSGRAGIRLLRTLLLDSGGESFLERAFLRLIREAGLPRPQTQVVHHQRDGRAIRVDFEFAGTNLVVEVSGRRGHTSDRDRQRDARRRNRLTADGLRVVEFTTADVIDDPAYVQDHTRAELASGHRTAAPRAVGA